MEGGGEGKKNTKLRYIFNEQPLNATFVVATQYFNFMFL